MRCFSHGHCDRRDLLHRLFLFRGHQFHRFVDVQQIFFQCNRRLNQRRFKFENVGLRRALNEMNLFHRTRRLFHGFHRHRNNQLGLLFHRLGFSLHTFGFDEVHSFLQDEQQFFRFAYFDFGDGGLADGNLGLRKGLDHRRLLHWNGDLVDWDTHRVNLFRRLFGFAQIDFLFDRKIKFVHFDQRLDKVLLASFHFRRAVDDGQHRHWNHRFGHHFLSFLRLLQTHLFLEDGEIFHHLVVDVHQIFRHLDDGHKSLGDVHSGSFGHKFLDHVVQGKRVRHVDLLVELFHRFFRFGYDHNVPLSMFSHEHFVHCFAFRDDRLLAHHFGFKGPLHRLQMFRCGFGDRFHRLVDGLFRHDFHELLTLRFHEPLFLFKVNEQFFHFNRLHDGSGRR